MRAERERERGGISKISLKRSCLTLYGVLIALQSVREGGGCTQRASTRTHAQLGRLSSRATGCGPSSTLAMTPSPYVHGELPNPVRN
jgi:hypothetical protein